MLMLGIELREHAALAVLVGEDGEVRARAEADGSRDLAASAIDALARVTASNGAVASLGVSSIAPESPATAAALAEAWIGPAKHARDIVFFAVDEYTTAGIVRDGVAVTGAHGHGPAVAWLALNPVEREDYRRTGCLQTEAAAAGIVRRLVWRIKTGDRSRVEEMVDGDLSRITVAHVLDGARHDDGVAFSVVRDTAKYLGMAAANLVAVADPEMLVLGGLMASAADLLLDPLRTEITRRLPRFMIDALTIAPAALGPDAAAIGAARLAAAALR